MSEKKKWYKSTWFTILTLIFIFPLGLFLMWKYMDWKRWVKILITVLIAIIAIINFTGTSESDNQPSKEQTTEQKDSDSKEESDEEIDTTDSSAIEEKPTEEKATSKPTREQKAALNKAETYSEMMHMSKAGIYKQLTSEYGEKFPADAAQYAVDNLKADYKKNALEKAKDYAEQQDMSTDAIYDQLISSYGEQFTEEEAQYA
ncbi:Ltp family lipoprotein, partial [Staphylococcus schleiferi subsp. coagulans]